MPTVTGTPVNGGYNTAATSHVINMPTGSVSGEVICIAYLLSETTRAPLISGYTDAPHTITVDSSFRMGIMYKTATGSDPATETMTFSPAGSTAITYSTFCISGADTADFLNSNPGVKQEDATATATPSVAASALSLASGSGCLVLMGCEANRSVSAFDADLDQQISTTANTNSFSVFIDNEVVGAGNPQYDFTINSSRRMGIALFELKVAEPAGPSFTSITDPIDSSISGTVSEAVTATHYRVSAGGTSANIEIPGGPITGTSFAVTGIDRENLPFIANAADTGAPATVSLTNEEVVVVSTTADLVTAAGTTAHIVTNPDLSSAHSIFNPLYCDTTPEDGQDQFWYTGDPGVSIAANGEVTGEGGFTLQAWDKSTGLRGAIASYTISGGVIYPRSPVGRSPVGVSPIGKSPKGIAA